MTIPGHAALQALARARITLDEQPAWIIGIRNRVATVITRNGEIRGEWSWSAAERIVRAGGRFVSH
jgi:hypothetical protein